MSTFTESLTASAGSTTPRILKPRARYLTPALLHQAFIQGARIMTKPKNCGIVGVGGLVATRTLEPDQFVAGGLRPDYLHAKVQHAAAKRKSECVQIV
jgi:hypothetical protein